MKNYMNIRTAHYIEKSLLLILVDVVLIAVAVFVGRFYGFIFGIMVLLIYAVWFV